MNKTSKTDRAIGMLMLIIGSVSFFDNIGTISNLLFYVNDYYYFYDSKNELITGFIVTSLIITLGLILLIIGIKTVLADKVTGQVFIIFLSACCSAIYFYRIIYVITSTNIFGGYQISSLSVITTLLGQIDWVFMALSVVLMIFSIISLKRRNAAASRSVYVQGYAAPHEKVCPNCGGHVEGTFCPKCGTRLVE